MRAKSILRVGAIVFVASVALTKLIHPWIHLPAEFFLGVFLGSTVVLVVVGIGKRRKANNG
jgi:hypothetical protein